MKILIQRTSLFALAAGAFMLAISGCNPNRNNPNLNGEPSAMTPSSAPAGEAQNQQATPSATPSAPPSQAAGGSAPTAAQSPGIGAGQAQQTGQQPGGAGSSVTFGSNGINYHASQPGTMGWHGSNPGNATLGPNNQEGSYGAGGTGGKSPAFSSNTGSIAGPGDMAIGKKSQPGTAISPRGNVPAPQNQNANQ